MARLWSSGFELNSIAFNMEWTDTDDNNPAIETTTIRSGTYSLEGANVSTVSEGLIYQFKAADTNDGFYFRVYMRITTAVSGQADILRVWGATTAINVEIRLNTDNTLELWNVEDNAQIGSDSSALDADTWYRIELKVDCTTKASTEVEARIDGTSFASGTINLADGLGRLAVGKFGSVSGDINFDDIAINDSSGSFQNSWPGAGEIIHLRPNAVGDNSEWDWDGGGDSYNGVDEVTPNDATDFVQTQLGPPNLDDYNLDATPVALASGDTINVVQVGVRYRVSEAGSGDGFSLRIKASASGTVEESAEITPSGTTWVTNTNAAPRNYPLTLYDLPGASTTAWTKADLDTAQIGINQQDYDGDGWTQVSTLWLLVDHKPAEVAGGDTPDWPTFQSRGFWSPQVA